MTKKEPAKKSAKSKKKGKGSQASPPSLAKGAKKGKPSAKSIKPKKQKKTKPPQAKKNTAPKAKTSWFSFLVKWVFVLGLWLGIGLTALFAWYAAELPDIAAQASFSRKAAIIIKDSKGDTLVRYGEIKGNSVTVEELPPHLIQAVLAIEDRRFYTHPGMDIFGFSRAMWVNIKAQRFVQGGSTITQQLAKNLFLSHERTIKRKIQEAMLAFWLENQLTKDEILSAYLNRVYLGAGLYGVDAAARRYFDKDVKDINLQESAILAGLLKAPSRYSPLKNAALSRKRANIVLKAMVAAGYITQSEAKALKNPPPRPIKRPGTGRAERYFTDWIIEGLDDLIGTPDGDIIIETTLDSDLQKAASQALFKTLRAKGQERAMTQGAILLMRPDGAVIAMLGGRDYNQSQFNRATQAKRPPGSAFKPILFLSALEQGWRPNDKILDEAFDKNDSYRPRNFNDKYAGEVTLGTALSGSLNTAAVRLMQETGRKNTIKTARKLGIFSPLEPDLSLALGSSGVSLLEMSTAYTVIANGGMAAYPYAITKITASDGTLYYSRPERQASRRVAEKRAIKDLQKMMRNVIENGTGRRAQMPFPASGKTGTSQDNRDAWFIGFSDKIVGGVWLGNDDNTPMNGVTGGAEPAEIWRVIMMKAQSKYKNLKSQNFSNDGGFVSLLDRLTGGFSKQNAASAPRESYND